MLFIEPGPEDTPMFLTDSHDLLEAPTTWAFALLGDNSGSRETLKQYTSILARYLQWLDDTGTGSINWAVTCGPVIGRYIVHLRSTRDEEGSPNDSTIEWYIARIKTFFEWARENGYVHYWNMDVKIVDRYVKDETMVNHEIRLQGKVVKLQYGTSTSVNSGLQKFVLKDQFEKALGLFEDVVYKFIAVIIWMTALRPKELMQLPYAGFKANSGLRRYRDEELDYLEDIHFEFASKGKRRSIEVPAQLWKVICQTWMPIRNARAKLYQARYGTPPPAKVLFLSKDGRPVTYKMIWDNFSKVGNMPEYPGKRFIPKMLRHSFATYFVLAALKKYGDLGKPYVYNPVIDQELREWMGHSSSQTTYKFYVHLVNRCLTGDLIYDLRKETYRPILDKLGVEDSETLMANFEEIING